MLSDCLSHSEFGMKIQLDSAVPVYSEQRTGVNHAASTLLSSRLCIGFESEKFR